MIELNFNDSSISNLQSKYKDTREDFTRSIAEGKAGAQNYEQSIESAKLSSQRKVAAIEKAQDYITKSFSNNNDPNVYNNIIQTFGTPVESYGKSVGIPESGNQMNQSLLLAEILVSSQYYKDKSTGEYKKLKDSEGTKVATDAFNKVNNLTSVMGLNKSKLAAYKTMTTLDLLEGFRSFYSTDMINDMKRLTLSLRDLKNL